jgi:hypothetical protein
MEASCGLKTILCLWIRILIAVIQSAPQILALSISPFDGSELLTKADSRAVGLLIAGVYTALHCFSRIALKIGEPGVVTI